jgi:hypothetical protein
VYSKRGKQNYFLIENLEKYLVEGEVKTAAQVVNGTELALRKKNLTISVKNRNKQKN